MGGDDDALDVSPAVVPEHDDIFEVGQFLVRVEEQHLIGAAAAALAAKGVLGVGPRADRAFLRDHVEQADAAAIAGVAHQFDVGAARRFRLGYGG